MNMSKYLKFILPKFVSLSGLIVVISIFTFSLNSFAQMNAVDVERCRMAAHDKYNQDFMNNQCQNMYNPKVCGAIDQAYKNSDNACLSYTGEAARLDYETLRQIDRGEFDGVGTASEKELGKQGGTRYNTEIISPDGGGAGGLGVDPETGLPVSGTPAAPGSPANTPAAQAAAKANANDPAAANVNPPATQAGENKTPQQQQREITCDQNYLAIYVSDVGEEYINSSESERTRGEGYKTDCKNGSQEYDTSKWSGLASSAVARRDKAERDALTASIEDIPHIYASDKEECSTAQAVAAECCGDPMKCFTKPDVSPDSDSQASVYGQIGMMLLGTAVNVPLNSVADMCSKMKTVAHITSGINIYLSQRCSYYVGKCTKSCGGTIAKIEQRPECANGACSSVIETMQLDFNLGDCKVANNRSTKLQQQAIQSTLASAFAAKCKDQIESDKKADTTADLFGNPSCTTPGAASNPICQEKCTRPGAASDPNCLGYPGLGNGGTGVDELAGNGTSKNPFDGLVPDDEGAQVPVTPDVAAQALKSSGGGQGGGSSGGLGGGGGDGGGVDGGAQAGPGEGYNTAIMKGTMSGGGYSSSPLRGVSGGFSGYGGSKAVTAAAKPFNLKDYLPGSTKPKSLAMRGIASVPGDISPAHANIFKKVTDRFYQVCLRNALYDCPSMKKASRAGIKN